MFINQGQALEKINAYLEKKRMPLYDEDGFCNGLVALYLYQGKEWLENKLNLINNSNIDNLNHQDELEFEKFINTAFFLQNPKNYLPHLGQKDIAEAITIVNGNAADDAPLQKLGAIPFVFKKEELVNIIRNVVRENQLIALHSSDHAIGLIYKNNKYYLYDPNGDIASANQSDLEIVCNTPEELVEKLQALFITSFDSNYSAENIPLAINILCKKEHFQDLKNVTEQSLKDINIIRTQDTINNASWDGTTALHMLALHNKVDLVNKALSYNPAIDAIRGPQKSTSLMLAAQNNYPQVMKLLLDKGADSLKTNKNGMNALHLAAKSGAVNAVKLLLEQPTFKLSENVDLQDNEGTGIGERTALHYAAMNGHLEIVKALVEANAELNKLDENGYTPLQLAIANGQVEVAQYLLSQPNINLILTDNTEDNLLHTAINSNLAEITAELVNKHPGLIFTENEDGYTGFDYAILDCFSKDNLNLIKILFEKISDDQKYEAIITSLANENLGLFMLLTDNFPEFDKDKFFEKIDELSSDPQCIKKAAQAYYGPNTIDIDLPNSNQNIADINNALLARHENPQVAAIQLKQIADRYAEKDMPHIERFLYQKAADIDPKNGIILYNLGIIYQEFNDHTEAIKSFENALTINSNYDTLYSLALSYDHLHNYDSALANLRKAASLIDPSPSTWEKQHEVLAFAIEICDKKQDNHQRNILLKQIVSVFQNAHDSTQDVNEKIKILTVEAKFYKDVKDDANAEECEAQIRNLQGLSSQAQINLQAENIVVAPPKSQLHEKSIIQKSISSTSIDDSLPPPSRNTLT